MFLLKHFRRPRAIVWKQTAPISSAFSEAATSEAAGIMEIQMSFMTDLKKFAVNKMKVRRHRQTVAFLDSLPEELKKDVGWTGPNRRYE
jgi:hypothetical protein